MNNEWILNFLKIVIVGFFIYLIILFIGKISKQDSKKSTNYLNNEDKNVDVLKKKYVKKRLVTDFEKYFIKILEKNFGLSYRIIPQVPLSSIVYKNKEYRNQYQNELFRTIDIGVFDKEKFTPILMIELNDQSHMMSDRYARDLKVKEILNIAKIPLITFYSNKPNTEQYIVERIKNVLEEK